MENLLIIALILALAYYWLVYQKKVSEPTKPITPLTNTKNTQPNLDRSNQSTQTSLKISDDQELAPILDQLLTSIRQLNNQL